MNIQNIGSDVFSFFCLSLRFIWSVANKNGGDRFHVVISLPVCIFVQTDRKKREKGVHLKRFLDRRYLVTFSRMLLSSGHQLIHRRKKRRETPFSHVLIKRRYTIAFLQWRRRLGWNQSDLQKDKRAKERREREALLDCIVCIFRSIGCTYIGLAVLHKAFPNFHWFLFTINGAQKNGSGVGGGEIERNDSGVGSETSGTAQRLRRMRRLKSSQPVVQVSSTSSNDHSPGSVPWCIDCDQPIESDQEEG